MTLLLGNRSLSARTKNRALALALLLGAIGLVGLGIFYPFWLVFIDGGQNVDRSQRLIAGFEAKARMKPDLEAALKDMQVRQASATGLVNGGSAALAAAQMQSEIRTIVEGDGGEIRTSQNLPASTKDGFETVEIRYDFSLPASRLKGLLYRIETHRPYFFIEDADIQMPESRSAGDVGLPEPKLVIRWTVRAYRWVGS